MAIYRMTNRLGLGSVLVVSITIAFLARANGFVDANETAVKSALETVPESAWVHRQEDPVLDELNLAQRLAASGDLESAESIFRALQDSPLPWHSWAATSGLLAAYRAQGRTTEAFELTRRVVDEAPDLRDLMLLWDGDTAVLANELAEARNRYERAEAAASDGIAQLALNQLARLALLENAPARAAARKRELMVFDAALASPEWTLAEALAYESMAAGYMPTKPLAVFLLSVDCTAAEPCIVRRPGPKEGSVEPWTLAGLAALRFELSGKDQAWLIRVREAFARSAATTKAAQDVCVPSRAADGFRSPFAESVRALGGMAPGSSSHERGTGFFAVGQVPKKSDPFFAVARGCVLDAFPGYLGAAAIEHYGVPDTLVSHYAHASAIYYSAGAAISKGAVLGKVVPSRLRHELREEGNSRHMVADRFLRADSETAIRHNHDPLTFYRAHSGSSILHWADEGAFGRKGDWHYVRGIGHRNDHRWISTTSEDLDAAAAHLTLNPPTSGHFEFWIFVPDVPDRSRKARYRVSETGNGRLLLGAEIDLTRFQNAWAHVGDIALEAGGHYTLALMANTGEMNRRVILDATLLARR